VHPPLAWRQPPVGNRVNREIKPLKMGLRTCPALPISKARNANMPVRAKRIPPALKHGVYSATALLPGEDAAAFEKLYKDLIAELVPNGPLEEATVATIARLLWRKQNLATFRIAAAARERWSEAVNMEAELLEYYRMANLQRNYENEAEARTLKTSEYLDAAERVRDNTRKELVRVRRDRRYCNNRPIAQGSEYRRTLGFDDRQMPETIIVREGR
jgi:hypothetical protein